MTDRLDLLQRLDYDFWANKLWLEALLKKEGVAADLAVLGHIMSAQEVWLQRCNGVSPDALPVVVPTLSELERQYAAWKSTLSDREDDPVIAYRRTTGEQLEMPLSQIAAQVFNHGTYHRGELRGLCRARSDEDFPETDLMRWLWTLAQ